MKLFAIFYLAFILTACNENADKPELKEYMTIQPNDKLSKAKLAGFGDGESESSAILHGANLQTSDSLKSVTKKMLIKNGRIEIEVRDIIKSKEWVDKIVNSQNGYYTNESLNKSDNRFDYHLTIRIPSQNLARFISEMDNIKGTITQQEISSQDVTDEYIDSEIRLANKMAYLERYREILSKANSVKDILEVEENIRGIEEEIESVKGRMQYLENQVNYSTLNINLYQINNTKMKPADGFFIRIVDSISKGWAGLTEFVLVIVMLWPFIIIGLVIFIFVLFMVRKSVRNRKST